MTAQSCKSKPAHGRRLAANSAQFSKKRGGVSSAGPRERGTPLIQIQIQIQIQDHPAARSRSESSDSSSARACCDRLQIAQCTWLQGCPSKPPPDRTEWAHVHSNKTLSLIRVRLQTLQSHKYTAQLLIVVSNRHKHILHPLQSCTVIALTRRSAL